LSQTLKPKKGFKKVKGLSGKFEEIPQEWKYVSFDKIIKQEKHSIKRGPFGSNLKKEFFVPIGYKVYEQKNAIYDDFHRGNYYINEKKFNELKDFEVKAGDFIISCSGTVGKISLAPPDIERGIINQALLKISVDLKIINPTFFKFLFRTDTIQHLFTSLTHGSAIKNIVSVKEIKQIPIKLPPLREQQKIASILSNIDELITSTQKMINQIKSIKKGLMQKLLTRGIGHKKFKKVGWLFGKEIEIPEEWEIKRLFELSETKYDIVAGPFGSNLKVDDYKNEGVPIIRLQNIERNKFINKNIKFISNEKAKELTYHSYLPQDLVLAKLGDPIGKTCKVPEDFLGGIVVADVVRIRTSSKISNQDFVEYVLNSKICEIQHNKEKIGTTRSRVNLEQIRNLQFPTPSLQEQQKIASILSNIDSQIELQMQYKEKLERVKKSLTQKLLVGEIRVSLI